MTRHIYINGRFLLQTPTGVQRYAYEMCMALQQCGVNFVIICPRHGKINDAYDITNLAILRYGIGSSHFWEQLVLPIFFIGKQNDLLVSFTGLGSILVRNKIMTVHDVSFLVCKEWFSKAYYLYYKPMTWLSIRTSKRIITVSEFSKHEILRFYPFLMDDRVVVVYNAADSDKFSNKSSVGSSDSPYCLAVSSLDPRKNFSRLLEAFRDIRGCTLKIVGGANKVFSQQPSYSSSSNVQFLGRVSDADLVELYRNAEAFIFPSLYEGFGLPVVEAMSVGCPVLASDIPVLHEVCGDAAMYFNPTDSVDMQRIIRNYLENSDQQRPAMVAKGRANIVRFSWQQSARLLIELIKSLC